MRHRTHTHDWIRISPFWVFVDIEYFCFGCNRTGLMVKKHSLFRSRRAPRTTPTSAMGSYRKR